VEVVELSGDASQRGWQHGQALRPTLLRIREGLHRDVIYRRGAVLGWGFRSLVRWLVHRMQRHIPTPWLTEARAVAEGAGIAFDDVLTLTCFDDVVHNLQYVVPVGRLACSGLAAQRGRTPTGQVLLARNMDYAPESDWWGVGTLITSVMRETTTVFAVRPEHGFAYVSIGWPGFLGVVTGMNETGLALACLTSTVRGETADGTPMPLTYRHILEQAETLDDCERILQATKRTIGNSLLVASARDAAVCAFELSPRKVYRRLPEEDLVLATNHFLVPTMGIEQNGLVVAHSLARLERIQTLTANTRIGVAEAQAMLLDEAGTLPTHRVHNFGTIYSAVLEPSAMRMWLRSPEAHSNHFRMVDVARLLAPRSSADGSAAA
jgi:predicted choloylglycine hydrolase